MTNIKVIIPAYNEADSIPHVIKDIPKTPQNYSASFWISNFSMSLRENPKGHRFNDIWACARVHDSRNQLC